MPIYWVCKCKHIIPTSSFSLSLWHLIFAYKLFYWNSFSQSFCQMSIFICIVGAHHNCSLFMWTTSKVWRPITLISSDLLQWGKQSRQSFAFGRRRLSAKYELGVCKGNRNWGLWRSYGSDSKWIGSVTAANISGIQKAYCCKD